MRIISGVHRGRKLKTPDGENVRPTSDRAREALFNVLAHSLDGFDLQATSVVDLFCGTGALGLEALSRGAGHVTFIDADRKSLSLAKENAAILGEWRRVTLLKIDCRRLGPPPLAAKSPCGLAFLDAPYNLGLTGPALLALTSKGWLATDAIVVVEVAGKEILDPPRSLRVLDDRTYGAARLVFLQNRA